MIAVILLWTAVVAAQPPGFSAAGVADGCVLALGPSETDGVVPMWASCEWPDVSAADVAAALARPERYGAIWTNVLASRVIAREGAVLRVWQKHDLPAFADREVVVDWSGGPRADGWRFAWTTAKVAWQPAAGDERCLRYDAEWDVQALPGGGTRVTHEARYASGTLPAWLVRPFLADALAKAVASLRTYVGGQR